MQIKSVNIRDYENSLIEFLRRCNKRSIILIKNKELAKFLLKGTKKIELEEIEKNFSC